MEKDLIEQLGGPSALANALRTTPNAVANWRLEGRTIPWKRRPQIARIAAERGVTLPQDFWEPA